jgi:radical SAM superfamily enzyme YgiQ (UPF0313 family)
MDVLLVQPPFVQLNSPYPATAYLASFLRSQGHSARVVDLSIELFHRIFSRAGLTVAFAEAERRLAARSSSFDAATRANLLRYLSNAERYVESIDRVVGLLAHGDDAFAHELATAGRVPWGHRSEGFLEANDGSISAADAPLLASLIVEDLADFIRFSLDPEFSLVRYAESKASSQPDFRVVESAAHGSYLFDTWFRPLVAETLAAAPGPRLVCVTVPFPGTLPGALVFAQEAKRVLGRDLPIAFGGGYVSTELRALRDPGIFVYADYLCYDAGFGALSSVVGHLATGMEDLHKTIVRREGRFIAYGFEGADRERFQADASYETRDPAGLAGLRSVDQTAIRTVFPDYAGLDFSRYVRIVEGANPMHALWSDTKWLKARLAHGCYWRRCAFCDTSLEYIARFAPSSPEALFEHLLVQSQRTGQHGVHFVDEALPVPHLVRFAMANIGRGRPLAFWGNARLERRFTPDACALLAEGGLVGVSAGLEVPTDRGLASTRKGLVLPDVVASLVALKSNGILVHVYLIYGLPDQEEGEVVDSLEIVRQLFAAGLVDSAFWHKFILTRHTPMYAEWKAGARPDLRVLEREWTFGSNDLSFEGEDRLSRFGPGLDAALGSWMEDPSTLDRPVTAWFGFRAPRPSVPGDRIERLARAARRKFGAPEAGTGKKIAWLGGRLLREDARTGDGSVRVSWSYRNRLEHVVLGRERAQVLVEAVPASRTMDELLARMNAAGTGAFETTKEFSRLRRAGLAAF